MKMILAVFTTLALMFTLPANALHNDPGWNDHTPRQQKQADRHEAQMKRKMQRNLRKMNREAARAERNAEREAARQERRDNRGNR